MRNLQYFGRVVRRNMMLCDGTPRRERGYRAYVHYRADATNVYAESQLFDREAEAVAWMPAEFMEAAS